MYKSLLLSLPLIAGFALLANHAHAGDNGIAAMVHKLRAEGGKVCQDGHFHVGTSPALDNKDKALKYALDNWSQFTIVEYGTSWGNFQSAAERSTDCWQEGTGTQWTCKVRARPCRAGMSTASK
jgi:hypothetical protein